MASSNESLLPKLQEIMIRHNLSVVFFLMYYIILFLIFGCLSYQSRDIMPYIDTLAHVLNLDFPFDQI